MKCECNFIQKYLKNNFSYLDKFRFLSKRLIAKNKIKLKITSKTLKISARSFSPPYTAPMIARPNVSVLPTMFPPNISVIPTSPSPRESAKMSAEPSVLSELGRITKRKI